MLRIRVLGELALERDGEEVAPPKGLPAQMLLGWLALKPELHPRSVIAGHFWPETQERTARTNLRSALADVRRALGSDADRYLRVSRDAIGIADSEEVWIDLAEFGRLLDAGEREQALGLGRGELLAGLDADWVLDARAEHDARVVSGLAAMADEAERGGNLPLAIEHTRERIRRDPLSESAARELMRRLASDGNAAAAVAAYDELRGRLETELGLEPGLETSDLARELRSAARERAAPMRVEAIPPAPDVAIGRFVGRGSELEALRAQWRAAREGRRQLSLIVGEPGIGKTRLAAELAREAHADGAAILSGRSEPEPLGPYKAFREALGAAAPQLSVEELSARLGPAATSELTALLPLLDAAREIPPAIQDQTVDRYRLFESAAALLRELSASRPLLLVLDDLHWADQPTLLMFGHLVRATVDTRLMVLATYRHVEVGREHPLSALLADLRREHPYETQYLSGLSEGEVADLLDDRAPGSSDAAAQQLHERTGGNPFFVQELIRDRLGEDPVGGDTAAEAGHAWGQTPRGAKDVVTRRVSALGDTAEDALVMAAVLGQRFELRVLEQALDLERPALLDAIEAAAAAELIRELTEPIGAFTFAHALVCDALYEELSAVRRARMHATVAAALEALGPETEPELLPQLAHHHFEAIAETGAEKAVAFGWRAGQWSLEHFGYEEAARHLDRALLAMDQLATVEPADRLQFLGAAGEAWLRSGDVAEARTRLADAATLARELGDSKSLARAALGFSGLGITILTANEEAISLLEEAAQALDPVRDAGLLSRVLGRLAVELYYEQPRERCLALSGRAVSTAKGAEDRAALIDALIARRVALWTADQLRERRTISDQIVELAVAAEDGERELQGRGWLIVDLAELGEFAALAEQVDTFEALSDQLRLPAHAWYVPVWRAMLAILEGRFTDSLELMARAYDLGTLAQDANAPIYLSVQKNTLWLFAAPERFEPEALPERYGTPADGSTTAARAVMYAKSGEPEKALRDVEYVAADDFAVLLPDVNWLGAMSLVSDAAVEIGYEPPMARLYELLRPFAGHWAVQARAVTADGAVDYYLGRLAAAMGQLSTAIAHYEVAARLHERAGGRPLLAWTKAEYAATLRRRNESGDGELAERLERDARAIQAELDGWHRRSGAAPGGASAAG